MNAIRRLLGGGPAAPPLVETDEVYPLHMLDDTPTLRGIVVTWTLRFDDVLDADALHVALSRLLDIGDWRKLGGRLRLDVSDVEPSTRPGRCWGSVDPVPTPGTKPHGRTALRQ